MSVDPIVPGCAVASDGTVTFAYRDAAASSVVVASDFTGWDGAPLPLARVSGTDLWTAQVKVPGAGLHAYKYIVDGRWIADPASRLTRADGFGGRNSVFVAGRRSLGGPGAIRVASLNLHTYQERDPVDKLEQIAIGMAAMEVDVLLLQEVGEHMSDPARPNAGEIVRRHMEAFTGRGWDHAWREAHIGFDVYREGLSVISAAPLQDIARVQLSGGGLSRIAVAATTVIGGVTLRVVTAHISWVPAEGEAESKRLLEALDAPGPQVDATVVAGDFNCAAGGPAVRVLRERGFTDAGAAAGVETPTLLDEGGGRIDFQLIRGGARPAPHVEAFARVFDGDTRHGYQPRVSDHAGLVGAYRFA